MRSTLIVANWKLNKSVAEALDFVAELTRSWPTGEPPPRPLQLVVAPPATALWALKEPLARLGVQLAAQELYPQDSGAFTGALSAPLLKEAGASYALVGHSERRALFGASNADCAARIIAAERHNLRVILCLGEDAAQQARGATEDVVSQQLEAAFAGRHGQALPPQVLAYEPVWAIGSGHAPRADAVTWVHRGLRRKLAALWGEQAAKGCRILYGGSVTADNVASYLEADEVDGALVGGASLQVASLMALLRKAAHGA